MSTFNGVVAEFPQIRIDQFRLNPSQPPPLACFLSHIHSDHLQGLESLKSPFVYCSPATRRLLLRLEKYPHRINFAKGILEARRQHYRHLQLILKSIPLATPTTLELGPQLKIRVTLLEANHCPGSVMFLIEGNGKAILYTGDVRAESWWVNSIVRNPVLVPYTLGNKALDCIYLDTTFGANEDMYRDFPEKAKGIHELLQKVQGFGPDTVFYFRAWTLGYEDVWVALSTGLDSKVHVDEYQLRLYGSLSEHGGDGATIAEAPALTGFHAGNHYHAGCLTGDENVRIHSCEPGTSCHAALLKRKGVIWITPMITRTNGGGEVYEVGAGGGGGDLYQVPELDLPNPTSVLALEKLCADVIKDSLVLSEVRRQLSTAGTLRHSRLSLEGLGLDPEVEVPLSYLVSQLASSGGFGKTLGSDTQSKALITRNHTSDTIYFPFSRHSSYNELRHLVSAFTPKDICPCTVNEEEWREEVSMQSLFGDLCSDTTFRYDREVREVLEERAARPGPTNTKKRKFEEGGETQEDGHRYDGFQSAAASPQVPAAFDASSRTGEESSKDVMSTEKDVRHSAPLRLQVNVGTSDHTSSAPDGHLEIIKANFRALNEGRDEVLDPEPRIPSGGDVDAEHHSPPGAPLQAMDQDTRSDFFFGIDISGDPVSQISLTSSAFESQAKLPSSQDQNLWSKQLDGADHGQSVGKESTSRRVHARKEAYRAARQCLLDPAGSGQWDDLSIRSVGRNGHIEEEIEL